MSEETRSSGLAPVAEFITNLKFKKAVVGGVDQEDALNSMRKLTQIFTEVYNGVVAENESLETQLAEARKQLAERPQGVTVPSVETEELKEQVMNLRELLDQKEEALAAAEGARDSLLERLSAQEAAAAVIEQPVETDEKADMADRELNEAVAETEAARQEAAAAREATEAARAELEQLRSQLAELRETKQQESSDRETLEEVYVSANRRRNEILSEAQAKADAIQAEIERARADLDLTLSQQEAEAQARYQKCVEGGEALLAEARAKCEEIQREAEEKAQATVDEAHALAAEIVKKAEDEAETSKEQAEAFLASAGDNYRAERARYEEMLVRLGELRKAVLDDIRADVDKLQEIAFDMTRSSIQRDSEAVVLMNDLDEEEKEKNP